jgi:hypothetical protein
MMVLCIIGEAVAAMFGIEMNELKMKLVVIASSNKARVNNFSTR